jgi:hypothetical protein
MPQIPLQAMLAQMGAQGGPPPEQQEPGEGDWLVNAINSVHSGMVQEADPKQVSLLGAILNQLTTFQANRANAGAQGQQGG